ncbi:MAG: hypothetical protein LR015_13060 [Verrucomicrobia bacterium]|nr:hypothetical protein [Verrucomicrobiota bacterium]
MTSQLQTIDGRLAIALQIPVFRQDLVYKVQFASALDGTWVTVASASNGAPFADVTPTGTLFTIIDTVPLKDSGVRFARLAVGFE